MSMPGIDDAYEEKSPRNAVASRRSWTRSSRSLTTDSVHRRERTAERESGCRLVARARLPRAICVVDPHIAHTQGFVDLDFDPSLPDADDEDGRTGGRHQPRDAQRDGDSARAVECDEERRFRPGDACAAASGPPASDRAHPTAFVTVVSRSSVSPPRRRP